MRTILGNLAIDKLIFDSEKESPGGPPFFIAKALRSLDIPDVHIVSTVGSDFDKNFFDSLNNEQLHLITTNAPTTRVGIRKDEDGKEYGFLISYSGKINSDLVQNQLKESEIVYVSTVLDEVSPEVLNKFQNSLICLDIQGFIRKPSENKWLRVKWSRAEEYLEKIDLIKISDYELEFLPKSLDELVKKHQDLVALITFGKNGAIAYSKGEYYFLPALAKEIKNPVGAGDYMFTCFSERYYESGNVKEALAKSTLEVAEFLQGRKLNLSLNEILKMVKITKNLYTSLQGL